MTEKKKKAKTTRTAKLGKKKAKKTTEKEAITFSEEYVMELCSIIVTFADQYQELRACMVLNPDGANAVHNLDVLTRQAYDKFTTQAENEPKASS